MLRDQAVEVVVIFIVTIIMANIITVLPEGLKTLPLLLEGLMFLYFYNKHAKIIDKLNSERNNYVMKLKYEEFILILDNTIWNSIIIAVCEDIIVYSTDKTENTYSKIYANALTRLLNTLNEELPIIQKIYGKKFLENYFDTYMTIKTRDKSILALINAYGTKQ